MKRYFILCCFIILANLLLGACGSDQEDLSQLNSAVATTPSPTANLDALKVGITPYAFNGTPDSASPKPEDLLVTVNLDLSKVGPAISPYIYGLAASDDSDPNYNAKLHPGLFRWGGNPSTRYNWVLGNAWNTGRDGGFHNTNYGYTGNNAAGEAISDALKKKLPVLLTIPTIGWVARSGDSKVYSQNVPEHGNSPLALGSDAIKGYDPATNQALTSVKSLPRKSGPFVSKPDPKSDVVYQDEWVASLVKQYGPAKSGGVKFYAMDNEPELWSETHTDVHPARMGYDDLLANFVEYASAIKDVDSSAEITGPVSAGWQGYFFSELDRGSDNFKQAADRAKHNNEPFIPWFLEQLRTYEEQKGQRLLDVLDIHYYPQSKGVYEGKTDPDTNLLRLKSTRSLWDNNYIDNSWIGTQIRLIPRLQEWVNTYYPGTKIGISEWNFGADNTMNGALAISQVLGTFGREGVYMAAYWRNPPAESPGFYAFKMYTNFDDKGSSFGDKSVPVKVSNDQRVSSFAALDSKSGRLRLILINQQPATTQAVSVQLAQPLPAQSAQVYQLSAKTNNKIVIQPALELSNATTKLDLSLPAYSITLLDLQPAGVKAG